LTNTYKKDAVIFATLLKNTVLPKTTLKIGNFVLKGSKGVKNKINYNNVTDDSYEDIDMLSGTHEYTFHIQQGDLEVSLQLYENNRDHYRLFCYTRFNNTQGMTFSVNLTTEKESDDIIYLTQKIKFAEQYKGDKELAQAHRRQKQIVFCDLLKKMGYDISENSDVLLGIFDPIKKELVNTTVEGFLNDFLVISLIKGHFQGNKGYQLEILPNYNHLDYIFNSTEITEDGDDTPVLKKSKSIKQKRIIPLGMRYKVFKRDSFRCVACGRTSNDGVKLHIDHKTPFSLGGLTEMNNLQTLCQDCNISKSNKFIDD
jgi:hypothetical protein